MLCMPALGCSRLVHVTDTSPAAHATAAQARARAAAYRVSDIFGLSKTPLQEPASSCPHPLSAAAFPNSSFTHTQNPGFPAGTSQAQRAAPSPRSHAAVSTGARGARETCLARCAPRGAHRHAASAAGRVTQVCSRDRPAEPRYAASATVQPVKCDFSMSNVSSLAGFSIAWTSIRHQARAGWFACLCLGACCLQLAPLPRVDAPSLACILGAECWN